MFIYGIRSVYKKNIFSQQIVENKETKKLDPIHYIGVTVVITILVVAWFFLIPEISKAMVGYYAFQDKPANWGIDAITNGLNLVGIVLMIRGYRNQYDIWLLVNILSIAIYALIMVEGKYFALSLIIVFLTYLGATIYGIRAWYFGNMETLSNKKTRDIGDNLAKLLK